MLVHFCVKVSSTFDTMIGKSADFNTSLIQQIKALETISNMKVTLPYGTSNGQGGSTSGNNTCDQNCDVFGTVADVKNPNMEWHMRDEKGDMIG